MLWSNLILLRVNPQIRDGIVGTGENHYHISSLLTVVSINALGGIKPYNILILFMSLAYMAITLDISGILQASAFWVSNKGGFQRLETLLILLPDAYTAEYISGQ